MAEGTRRINMGKVILPIANYPQFILNQYQEIGQKPGHTATLKTEQKIQVIQVGMKLGLQGYKFYSLQLNNTGVYRKEDKWTENWNRTYIIVPTFEDP